MANNQGTPEHLRDERRQRIRLEREEEARREAARAELLATHEEERRRMEEGRRELEEEKKREEERKRKEEEDRVREEQEAVARRVVEEQKRKEEEKVKKEQADVARRVAREHRRRGMQQPVREDADDALSGVGQIFNDSTSGLWLEAAQPARNLAAFGANAFADKRAARAERKDKDHALRAARKAKKDEAIDASFDSVAADLRSMLEEPTPEGAAVPAVDPPLGVTAEEQQNDGDDVILDYDEDQDMTNDKRLNRQTTVATGDNDDDDDDDYTSYDSDDDDLPMDTNELDGRGEGSPLGEGVQPVDPSDPTDPAGVRTLPPPPPPERPPPTQTPQVVAGSSTPQVTSAADAMTTAPSHVSSDATLVIPSPIEDLSSHRRASRRASKHF